MQTGIALFVYNRPWHTQQVLSGLKRNKLQKLYIFSDGAKNEDDKKSIQEVRELITLIDWCDAEIIKSETNKGLARSIVDGVNYVLTKHPRIIVLEDDCLPSPDFIDFMERCLDRYENSSGVMSITGFNMIEIPQNYLYDIYFFYRSSVWGWGTWRRAWEKFSFDEKNYTECIDNKIIQKEFNRGGTDLSAMLKAQIEGKINSWAIKWAYTHYKYKGVCVHPVMSRIKNIGFDGSGTHCETDDKYNEININFDSRETNEGLRLPDEIFIDSIVEKRYLKKIKLPLIQRIKRRFIREIRNIFIDLRKISSKNC